MVILLNKKVQSLQLNFKKNDKTGEYYFTLYSQIHFNTKKLFSDF